MSSAMEFEHDPAENEVLGSEPGLSPPQNRVSGPSEDTGDGGQGFSFLHQSMVFSDHPHSPEEGLDLARGLEQRRRAVFAGLQDDGHAASDSQAWLALEAEQADVELIRAQRREVRRYRRDFNPERQPAASPAKGQLSSGAGGNDEGMFVGGAQALQMLREQLGEAERRPVLLREQDDHRRIRESREDRMRLSSRRKPTSQELEERSLERRSPPHTSSASTSAASVSWDSVNGSDDDHPEDPRRSHHLSAYRPPEARGSSRRQQHEPRHQNHPAALNPRGFTRYDLSHVPEHSDTSNRQAFAQFMALQQQQQQLGKQRQQPPQSEPKLPDPEAAADEVAKVEFIPRSRRVHKPAADHPRDAKGDAPEEAKEQSHPPRQPQPAHGSGTAPSDNDIRVLEGLLQSWEPPSGYSGSFGSGLRMPEAAVGIRPAAAAAAASQPHPGEGRSPPRKPKKPAVQLDHFADDQDEIGLAGAGAAAARKSDAAGAVAFRRRTKAGAHAKAVKTPREQTQDD